MLKELRNRLGWSVNDLSDYIEVNSRTIRRWELGELPTPKAVILLLEFLTTQ